MKLLLCLLAFLFPVIPAWAVELEAATAPADNPLKGFMPYEGAYDFPHSLEWFYLPLKDLQKDYEVFDWQAFDKKLDAIAGRGHQAVFRIYLDYPGVPYGVPQFLDHVPKRAYRDHGNGANLQSVSFSPDYENPDLRRALKNFIAALGRRYDGDARLGFVTVGLLGFWGEWHTYPHSVKGDDFMASATVQNEVLDAYAKAFLKTKLLLREPKENLAIKQRDLGFHDDSFAYQTLGPEAWHFWPQLKRFDVADRWKTQPIGGEVRPEVQKCMWNEAAQNCVPPGQEYDLCVQTTHASWLLDQGVFDPALPAKQRQRAVAGARRLGYELSVRAVNVKPQVGALQIDISLVNSGVAPFYYDWPLELAAVDNRNQIAARWTADWKLSSVLPGAPQNWEFAAPTKLKPGVYRLLLRVVNPLPSGKILRFANKTQDQTVPGWLTLAAFSIEN